jgi:hypothetical protein
MEVDAKVTTLHAVAGIIAGYISYLLSTGIIKNDALALFVSLIILYVCGQASEKIFGKEAVGGFKGWLWSGIVPFFFIWLMVWVMLFNMPI